MATFKAKIDAGSQLVILSGQVIDISDFIQYHPGGQFVLRRRIGKDVTSMFKGGKFSGETIEGAGAHQHTEKA
jgi:cytochrome b involved in lipid metabolism